MPGSQISLFSLVMSFPLFQEGPSPLNWWSPGVRGAVRLRCDAHHAAEALDSTASIRWHRKPASPRLPGGLPRDGAGHLTKEAALKLGGLFAQPGSLAITP